MIFTFVFIRYDCIAYFTMQWVTRSYSANEVLTITFLQFCDYVRFVFNHLSNLYASSGSNLSNFFIYFSMSNKMCFWVLHTKRTRKSGTRRVGKKQKRLPGINWYTLQYQCLNTLQFLVIDITYYGGAM